jgi:hypothetical protein
MGMKECEDAGQSGRELLLLLWWERRLGERVSREFSRRGLRRTGRRDEIRDQYQLYMALGPAGASGA